MKSGLFGSCVTCMMSCFGPRNPACWPGQSSGPSMQVRRQVDAAGRALGAAAEVRPARGVVREVVAAGDLVEERAGLLVPGQDVVRGDEVVVLAVRQRPHDGVLVRPRGELRQVFAGEQAGRLRGDVLYSPRISAGASGLGSNVSRWLAAPVRKTMMTDFGFSPGSSADRRGRRTTARGRAARSSRPAAFRGG